jgi:hypothetical protein
MALSTTVRDQWDTGSVTISDGTAVTPLEVVVQFDSADFAIQGLTDNQRADNVYQGRGAVRSVRPGEFTPATISFSCMVSQLTEATVGTALDMIRGTGFFAARVGTLGTSNQVTLDVEFSTTDTVITCTDVRFSNDYSQGAPNTLTFSGTVYGTVSIATS